MRCRFPGCTRELTVNTTSGVCRGHNHQKPWCLCTACTGEPKRFLDPRYRPPKKQEPKKQELKKQEPKPEPVTLRGRSGSKIRCMQYRNMSGAVVSLPIAPWEATE